MPLWLPTSTSSVSSPLSPPSANTSTRFQDLSIIYVKLKPVITFNNAAIWSPQVIEVRQKESPHLLPEDVFVDNPKYVASTFDLHSITPDDGKRH